MKYPQKPSPRFCARDWGMHSCALLDGHEEDHLCVCGEREPMSHKEAEDEWWNAIR